MDHSLLVIESHPDTPVSSDTAPDSGAQAPSADAPTGAEPAMDLPTGQAGTHATTEQAHGAAATGGLGAIGIDGRALLFQVINFVILLWILKKVAYKPILKLLDDRHRRIQEGLQKAAEAEQALANAEADKTKLLAQARSEADKLVAASQTEAADMVKAAEAKAHTRAEQIVAEAHERTEREAGTVRKQLRKELGGLVAAATETLIEEKLDAQKDSALIEKALAKAMPTGRQAEGR